MAKAKAVNKGGRPKSDTVAVTLKLHPETAARLRASAPLEGRTLSGHADRLITEGLDRLAGGS